MIVTAVVSLATNVIKPISSRICPSVICLFCFDLIKCGRKRLLRIASSEKELFIKKKVREIEFISLNAYHLSFPYSLIGILLLLSAKTNIEFLFLRDYY